MQIIHSKNLFIQNNPKLFIQRNYSFKRKMEYRPGLRGPHSFIELTVNIGGNMLGKTRLGVQNHSFSQLITVCCQSAAQLAATAEHSDPWLHTCLCQEEEKTAGWHFRRPALSQSVFCVECSMKGTAWVDHLEQHNQAAFNWIKLLSVLKAVSMLLTCCRQLQWPDAAAAKRVSMTSCCCCRLQTADCQTRSANSPSNRLLLLANTFL